MDYIALVQHGLSTVLNAATLALLPVGLVALTITTAIVAAGWNRRRAWLQRQGPADRGDRFELGQTAFASGVLDIATEVRAVLRQLEGLAARRFVALELAIQRDLAVRADPRAFREILHGLVASAIDASPCGRVLVGAVGLGNRSRITVSDDGATVERELRASRLRPAERLAALQGATVEVRAYAGQGTTVVVMMPAGRRSEGDRDRLDPASVWDSVARSDAGSGATRQ